jgi:hypothetical protein
MVMGKNCEYDGLDLIELLSEEFEVTLHPCHFLHPPLPNLIYFAACL